MTTSIVQPESLPAKLSLFAADIKISHTIFAMPWALLATVMAWRASGGPIAGKLALILICMIAARTVAMAANRLLDAHLDAKNPRTARRAIPSGALPRSFYVVVLAACGSAFIGVTGLFWFLDRNPLPIVLSVPVLAYLCAYPLMKRFTRLCHYYLGAALGLAPICAWIAITGGVSIEPVIMALAVLCWTAGFDIIYSCQDYPNDLETGVVSVPARVGIARALRISRLTHVVCIALLILLGMVSPQLSWLYFCGVAGAVALLIFEHALVKPHDLSKVNVAFFTLNGIISLLVGSLGMLDVLL